MHALSDVAAEPADSETELAPTELHAAVLRSVRIDDAPMLVVLSGERSGTRLLIRHRPVVIGRAPECDLRLNDQGISRQHCRIECRHGRIYIQDLGSTNGTRVNERSVLEMELHEGDYLTLGGCLLKVLRRDALDDVRTAPYDDTALCDPLTGVPNRRLFRDRLDAVVADVRRTRRALSLALLDLDHFKRVNDAYGAQTGDAVLKYIAGILGSVAGPYLMARLSGDEFVLLLPDAALTDAVAQAERWRASVGSYRTVHAVHRIRLTASVGVSTWDDSMQSSSDLLRRADDFLNRGKSRGRDRVYAGD